MATNPSSVSEEQTRAGKDLATSGPLPWTTLRVTCSLDPTHEFPFMSTRWAVRELRRLTGEDQACVGRVGRWTDRDRERIEKWVERG